MDFNKNKSRVFRKKGILKRIINYLKLFVLSQLKGVKLGNNIQILGKTPIIKKPCNGQIILDDYVVLNSDFAKSNSALTTPIKLTTGYDGLIHIGKHSILNGSCIVSYESVEIGEYCEIASCTLISDTDFHPVDPIERLKQMKGESFSFDSVSKRKITIGNNVWIGYGAIILKGCKIGNNCIIAAGAICPGNSIYPDNCVIAGNPAKIVKKLVGEV